MSEKEDTTKAVKIRVLGEEPRNNATKFIHQRVL